MVEYTNRNSEDGDHDRLCAGFDTRVLKGVFVAHTQPKVHDYDYFKNVLSWALEARLANTQ